jgi:cell division protease FtsH
MQLPLEDRYLMQKRDLLNQLAILLGGRAAEEIAVGEVSTGAQNDLQRVTDVARSMVTEWGMSDSLGTVNYEPSRRGRFLDLGLPSERGVYSEETARQIDEEVKRLVANALNEARRVLRENRDLLERVARRLLEKEVVEGFEPRGAY